jgi:hypothetical protein
MLNTHAATWQQQLAAALSLIVKTLIFSLYPMAAGATTLSIMTLSIATFTIMALSIPAQ